MSISVLTPERALPEPRVPKTRTPRQRTRRIAISLAGVVGFLLLWLLLGVAGVLNPSSIPGLPETAAALGVPVGTAKSRLSRALNRLRSVMPNGDRRP